MRCRENHWVNVRDVYRLYTNIFYKSSVRFFRPMVNKLTIFLRKAAGHKSLYYMAKTEFLGSRLRTPKNIICYEIVYYWKLNSPSSCIASHLKVTPHWLFSNRSMDILSHFFTSLNDHSHLFLHLQWKVQLQLCEENTWTNFLATCVACASKEAPNDSLPLRAELELFLHLKRRCFEWMKRRKYYE